MPETKRDQVLLVYEKDAEGHSFATDLRAYAQVAIDSAPSLRDFVKDAVLFYVKENPEKFYDFPKIPPKKEVQT